jgi:hypothetical protein
MLSFKTVNNNYYSFVYYTKTIQSQRLNISGTFLLFICGVHLLINTFDIPLVLTITRRNDLIRCAVIGVTWILWLGVIVVLFWYFYIFEPSEY